MRIAIIGGTGFVGSYLTDSLLADGHEIRMLVRPGSESKVHRSESVQQVSGDLSSAEALQVLMQGCDAAIYSVGILREEPKKNITFEAIQYDGAVKAVDAAVTAGVPRLILMSANGAKMPGTAYQETKFRAEQYAKQSGLNVSVFRPSVIFGDPRGRIEIGTQLYQDMVKPRRPAINFFTGVNPESGSVVMSPVHINDLADAVLATLGDENAAGKTFTIGGPDVLSWKEMIAQVAIATGRTKWIVPMPVSFMYLAAAALDWLPFFPISREQLKMLAEGNTAEPADLLLLIKRPAGPFRGDNLQYLSRQSEAQ